MSSKNKIKFSISIDSKNYLEYTFGIITFILMFFDWCKFKYISFWGAKISEKFSLFTENMFRMNPLLGFAKITIIISLILFIIYIVSIFVDIKEMFSEIKFDVNSLISKVYYIFYATSLLLCFLGLITLDYYKPNISWYISLVFCILGILIVYKPNPFKRFLKKYIKIKK